MQHEALLAGDSSNSVVARLTPPDWLAADSELTRLEPAAILTRVLPSGRLVPASSPCPPLTHSLLLTTLRRHSGHPHTHARPRPPACVPAATHYLSSTPPSPLHVLALREHPVAPAAASLSSFATLQTFLTLG